MALADRDWGGGKEKIIIKWRDGDQWRLNSTVLLCASY